MANPKNKNDLPRQKRRVRRNSKHPKAITIHHILPRSRGGNDDEINKSKVIEYHHGKFHELFGNMTPYEVLAFLETCFWKGQEEWIDNYSFNRDDFIEK